MSGYRRSGTSMMMRAIQNGLQSGAVLYQPGQEKIGEQEEDGYFPNPSGLLEVGQWYYMSAQFLRMIPDESVLKILYDGLPNLPQGDYTIIFMERDQAEIEESCGRVDKHLRQVGVVENPARDYVFDTFRPYRQDDIDHVLGIMEARSDVRLLRVRYRDVIDDPLGTFIKLSKTPLGRPLLPIDPEKAAEIVNPEHYRCRQKTQACGAAPQKSS